MKTVSGLNCHSVIADREEEVSSKDNRIKGRVCVVRDLFPVLTSIEANRTGSGTADGDDAIA